MRQESCREGSRARPEQQRSGVPLHLHCQRSCSSAPRPAPLQVKRIDGIGSSEDSCVVQGVVCNKNLALRRMRTAIDTPRVLLLAGDLEHQRGREKKLLSFDTAIDQVGLGWILLVQLAAWRGCAGAAGSTACLARRASVCTTGIRRDHAPTRTVVVTPGCQAGGVTMPGFSVR